MCLIEGKVLKTGAQRPSRRHHRASSLMLNIIFIWSLFSRKPIRCPICNKLENCRILIFPETYSSAACNGPDPSYNMLATTITPINVLFTSTLISLYMDQELSNKASFVLHSFTRPLCIKQDPFYNYLESLNIIHFATNQNHKTLPTLKQSEITYTCKLGVLSYK